ncbi:MAG: hypothetical protein ABFD50_12745 [Smithella sp.]
MPTKPTLDTKNVTSENALKFAEALKQYEIDRADWDIKINIFRKKQRDMEAQFKEDVLEENGLSGHPKAGKVFLLAWQEGHSDGYQRVAEWVAELAELVL